MGTQETSTEPDVTGTHGMKRVFGQKVLRPTPKERKTPNLSYTDHIEITNERFRGVHGVWGNESGFTWGETNPAQLLEFIIDTSHCESTLFSRLTKPNKLYNLHEALSVPENSH